MKSVTASPDFWRPGKYALAPSPTLPQYGVFAGKQILQILHFQALSKFAQIFRVGFDNALILSLTERMPESGIPLLRAPTSSDF